MCSHEDWRVHAACLSAEPDGSVATTTWDHDPTLSSKEVSVDPSLIPLLVRLPLFCGIVHLAGRNDCGDRHHLMDQIFAWITHHRYPALFSLLMLGIVGLPVPDETLLLYAGYLIYKGSLAPLPTALTAFLGSACGISISYGIGRGLRGLLVGRQGTLLRLDPDKLEMTRRWYLRWGKYLLLLGYFLPGVRHLTALLAGSSNLPLAVFALFSYTGALIWSLSFLVAGYTLGEEWASTSASVHRAFVLVAALGIFLFVLIAIERHRRQT